MLNNFCFYVHAIVFAHPLCASLSCLQYGISFGNKNPDNVDRDYIVLLSNLIEEGTVQCSMYSGVDRSSLNRHNDVTKMGGPITS